MWLFRLLFTGQLARHRFEDLRRKVAAALKIQRALRIYLDRKSFTEAVVTIQSGFRGMAARHVLRRKTKATIVIQVAKSFFFFSENFDLWALQAFLIPPNFF